MDGPVRLATDLHARNRERTKSVAHQLLADVPLKQVHLGAIVGSEARISETPEPGPLCIVLLRKLPQHDPPGVDFAGVRLQACHPRLERHPLREICQRRSTLAVHKRFLESTHSTASLRNRSPDGSFTDSKRIQGSLAVSYTHLTLPTIYSV